LPPACAAATDGAHESLPHDGAYQPADTLAAARHNPALDLGNSAAFDRGDDLRPSRRT
jgi:hypothetical protein